MNKLYQQILIGKEDNLNLNNFWNKCSEIYPNVIRDFVIWLHYYNLIINNKIEISSMPFEFQVGIIFRYLFTESPINPGKPNLLKADIVRFICENFEIIENFKNETKN